MLWKRLSEICRRDQTHANVKEERWRRCGMAGLKKMETVILSDDHNKLQGRVSANFKVECPPASKAWFLSSLIGGYGATERMKLSRRGAAQHRVKTVVQPPFQVVGVQRKFARYSSLRSLNIRFLSRSNHILCCWRLLEKKKQIVHLNPKVSV